MITSGDDLDLNEQKAFLATYPSFTTSEVLLAKIIGLVRVGPTTHHKRCYPGPLIGERELLPIRSVSAPRMIDLLCSTIESPEERSDTKKSEARERAGTRRPPKPPAAQSLCASDPCPSR